MAANLEANKTECTTCGAKYKHTAGYCGVDGAALKPTDENAKPTGSSASQNQCARCSRFFPTYARYCPKDGSPLHVPNQGASAQDLIFAPQKDQVIGRTIAGKYKVERLLGEGGMAKVYSATNLEIEKTVVIKLMHEQISSKEKDRSMKRFLQEIKVSAQLNHPNLVSVFDGGEIEGRPYLVMEYIKGEALREYITDKGAASFEDAINIVSQICAGLQEAHHGGIVHRDLKPENIMLREDHTRPDWVKVVDFGIAHLKSGGSKLTATGIAIGTVDYMSPEYLADKPIDHRSDIYAVGVILFELLTGRCPFEAESAEAVMVKHLWTTPMPPSHSRQGMEPGCALDRIVEKALQKEPTDRYQSVADMRKDLQQALKNPTSA